MWSWRKRKNRPRADSLTFAEDVAEICARVDRLVSEAQLHEALIVGTQAFELHPSHAGIAERLMDVGLQLGHIEATSQPAAALARAGMAEATTLERSAECLMQCFRFADAALAWRNIARNPQEFDRAMLQAAECDYRAGDFESAIEAADRVLQRNAENLQAILIKAVALQRIHREWSVSKESVRDLVFALIQGNYLEHAAGLAVAAAARPQVKLDSENIIQVKEVIEERVNRAMLNGDIGSAGAGLRALRSLDPEHPSAQAMLESLVAPSLTRARDLSETQQIEEALETFEAVLALDPWHPEAIREAAKINRQFKQWDNAFTLWLRAAEIMPIGTTRQLSAVWSMVDAGRSARRYEDVLLALRRLEARVPDSERLETVFALLLRDLSGQAYAELLSGRLSTALEKAKIVLRYRPSHVLAQRVIHEVVVEARRIGAARILNEVADVYAEIG